MMTELAFTLFRLGFLVLLWLMVLGAVATLRRDIYGTVVTPRGKGQPKKQHKKKQKRSSGLSSKEPTKLLITGGPLTGTIIPLGTKPVSIGRAPSSTLVLEDPYASSRHAELAVVDGQWCLSDLASTNGTFVDDERIASDHPLPTGVTARIGQTTFELVT